MEYVDGVEGNLVESGEDGVGLNRLGLLAVGRRNWGGRNALGPPG